MSYKRIKFLKDIAFMNMYAEYEIEEKRKEKIRIKVHKKNSALGDSSPFKQ